MYKFIQTHKNVWLLFLIFVIQFVITIFTIRYIGGNDMSVKNKKANIEKETEEKLSCLTDYRLRYAYNQGKCKFKY